MKKFIIISLCLFMTACNGTIKRNDWQKNKSFQNKRELYYNQFVESGGMIPEDSNNAKKTVQDALNQGAILSE